MLKFHALQVSQLSPDAEDAVAVSLEVPEDLRPEFVGLPGQHVVLRTELGGVEARRTYSLVNVPGEWPLRIVARVHEKGQMSRYLATQVKVGDRIDVLPPNGSLTPRSSPQQASGRRLYVGFAAGCGITPVLCIARTVLRADPANQFLLFYGNTSTGRTMCLENLLELKDLYTDRLALHFVMSREPQDVELYNGRVDGARVRQLAQSLFKPEQVTEYFVCGPGDMIDQVTGALRELHVGADRIHSEHYAVVAADSQASAGQAGSTAEVGRSGAARQKRTATESIPGVARGADVAEVTVLMDGRRRSFAMQRNADTILDAAARSGLDLPFSCRAGVCSTCRTKVVSGEVEMAENYALEEWELEQGYILACQSRVKSSTLELDYDEK
jgi:ring-1,2-phenylacetyl-CoA epoxidase subunit PaaE